MQNMEKKIEVQITRAENAEFFQCEVGSIVKVELEKYVAAVVASEIGNAHIEACKAQAIAARSFALARGVLDGKPISDSSAKAQAYRAARYNSKYANAIAAAEATAGLALTYNNKVISAVYTAANGGQSVSAEEQWGSKRPYLISQIDPWDQHGNRVGHGVGMSQSGCKFAASKGYTYQQILEFYYPGTKIKQVIAMAQNEKAEAIAMYATACLGFPYVFGAWGEPCTPANRKRRARSDHPAIVDNCQVLNSKHKSTCNGCKYQDSLMFDCRGFTHWCLQQVGINISGQTVTSQYKDDNNWVAKGAIVNMPNVVCCVFKQDGNRWKHTGLHIGDGKIIHCSGEVKRDTLSNKTWTHFAIPKDLYSGTELVDAEVLQVMKTLKKGSKGQEVKDLQEGLKVLGLYDGAIDGKFGSGTEAAVKAFQKQYGLTVDGIVGGATWTKLISLMAGDNTMPDPEIEVNELREAIADMRVRADMLKIDLEAVMAGLEDLTKDFNRITKIGET